MSIKLQISSVIIFCLLAASCEKAIDFNGEEQLPRVVVRSEPEADTNVAVRITYSRFFLAGGSFKVIKNADVRLSVNGTQYTGLFNDSVYVFSYSAQEGDSLQLSVRMQNGGEDTVVTAGTRVPFRPSVQAKETIGNSCHFVLNDRRSEHNYYRLHLLSIDTVYNYFDADSNYVFAGDPTAVGCDTIVETWWPLFGCSDAALTSNMTSVITIGGEETYEWLLFSDELFDGQSREISLKPSDYDPFYYEEYKSASGSRSYILVLESLSREAYLYELSVYKQENGDIFMTEPVQMQCNIKGGLGIFGAKATTMVSLGTSSY